MKLTFVESPLGHYYYRLVSCGLVVTMLMCSCVLTTELTWMMADCLCPLSAPDPGLAAAPDPV